MYQKVVVRDSKEISECSKDSGLNIYFDEFVPGTICVGDHLTQNIEQIINDILAWNYDIARSTIRGKSIEELMSLQGFSLSFWWISMVSEKCIFKNDVYTELMKLRALEHYLDDNCPSEIIYKGKKNYLGNALRSWTAANNIVFQWENVSAVKLTSPPFTVKVRDWIQFGRSILVPLEELWNQIQTCGTPKSDRTAKEIKPRKQVALITYATASNIRVISGVGVESKFWGELPAILRRDGYRIKWIWFNTDLSRNGRKNLADLQSKANQKTNDTVDIIEDALNIKIVIKLFLMLFRVAGLKRRLNKESMLVKKFQFPASSFTFYSLFHPVWLKELTSIRGIRNLMKALCFDRHLLQYEELEFGMYLYEGQSWEKTLIWAWKNNQKGKLMGVQHSSMRLADLRQYVDPRAFSDTNRRQSMVPDLIVCNGESAHNLLRKFHMPQTHLLLAEALRYSSLTGRKDELKQYQGKKEIVLLIGDVNLFPTVRMLELLSDAVSQLDLDSDHSIFVKPHPDCPSLANFINQLGLSGVCSITTKPLDQLWSNIKVAVCSNSTTASIEAAWLGVPVAVMRDMSQVNLCPLGNISELIYFQSADQLVERINSPIQIEIPANYFSLDENYPRWHKILEELN